VKVVLLHALPLDKRMWESQRSVLSEHDVVTPNLYELGNSMDAWADAILDRLEGPFAAVGASMGGYCALEIARKAPERLTVLVLAGSRADADPSERRAARADTIRLVRERGVETLWDDMRPKLFPEDAAAEVVERAREIALEQKPEGIVAAVEAIRDRQDSTELVASLEVPVLVTVGDSDPFISVEDARGIAQSAPKGRLHVFEGCGHLPSMQRPEDFNRILVESL
jgi:pimeloyl-ACP methyl ester carboxylesterase